MDGTHANMAAGGSPFRLTEMPPDRLATISFLAVVAVWSLLHWWFRDIVIYHDNWIHNFPIVYAIGHGGACGGLAKWLMWPDTGAPTLIYTVSSSLTHPIRILLLELFACIQPQPFAAMLLYKLQVYFIYLGFSVGMLVLGRTLFQHWLSAVYLATATLFAGFCLDAAHSDQALIIVFWVPWCVVAAVLAHRHASESRSAFYLNMAVLFFCGAIVDQYPHFAIVAAAAGGGLYASLRFEQVKLLAVWWRRLWPALIALGVTATQLMFALGKFTGYVPSLRAAVTVDPSQFGVTGFVQPSAFFGLLFPLTYTTAFEDIAAGFGGAGSRSFVFHLDILIFYAGTIPLFFALAWFTRAGQNALKIGWVGFCGILLLLSLQQSGLYYVLFYVPFFNVFRSYFLFVPYIMFGVLVIGGYGFDRLLAGTANRRIDQIRKTGRFSALLFAFGAAAFALVIAWGGLGWNIFSYKWALVGDLATIGAAFVVLIWLRRNPDIRNVHAVGIIATLVITQALYAAVIYRTIGISAADAFARYELNATMLKPYSAAELAKPEELRRTPCPTFGSCYLALRDAVSLRRDADGTFLRQYLNPVFQDELVPSVKYALSGVTHPFMWVSATEQPVASTATLNHILNLNAQRLPQLLKSATFRLDPATANNESSLSEPRPITASLSDLERSADRVAVHYRSDRPAVVNLGVTYDRNWTATINGIESPLFSGNFGIAAARILAGSGVVALRYHDPWADLFFWSRYLMVGIIVLAALRLSVSVSYPPRRQNR